MSLQLISQAGVPIDKILLGDLAADYARQLEEAKDRLDKAVRAIAAAQHDKDAAKVELQEVILRWTKVNEQYTEARAALEEARRTDRDQWSKSRETTGVE